MKTKGVYLTLPLFYFVFVLVVIYIIECIIVSFVFNAVPAFAYICACD